MATSRTGTAKYKRWRLNVLHRDQAAGITHCQLCGCIMNYDQGKHPNSAEPDHILADKFGGQLTMDNGRTICRHCNQSRGDGSKSARAKRMKPATITIDFDW